MGKSKKVNDIDNQVINVETQVENPTIENVSENVSETAAEVTEVAEATEVTEVAEVAEATEATETATAIEEMTIDKSREIAKDLLTKYVTISDIRKYAYGKLIAKYGKSGTTTILASCKDYRKAQLDLHKDKAMGVLSYDSVLEREFEALKQSADFGVIAKYAGKIYDNVQSFVASCFTYVDENGMPLHKVSRCGYESDGTTLTIVERFEEMTLEKGETAISVLRTCLKNLAKVANILTIKTNGKVLKNVVANSFIGAYLPKTDSTTGKIVKGDKIVDYFYYNPQIVNDWLTLSAFNRFSN